MNPKMKTLGATLFRMRATKQHPCSLPRLLKSGALNLGETEMKKTTQEQTNLLFGALTLNQKCFNIYNAYPRHIQRGRALPAIETALRLISKEFPGEDSYKFLLGKVTEFAQSDLGQSRQCPYPSNWFEGQQYVDDTKEWDFNE